MDNSYKQKSDWRKEFCDRFVAFNDPDILDGFAKDEIMQFISTLLDETEKQAQSEMREWAESRLVKCLDLQIRTERQEYYDGKINILRDLINYLNK